MKIGINHNGINGNKIKKGQESWAQRAQGSSDFSGAYLNLKWGIRAQRALGSSDFHGLTYI